eukprot:CAMPEP_0206448894 /NCGR_PEP_ID=MMETSP0324_2-20121206/17764_1 /ASSEMBLY_ACC=CAM_ASM_000836 /TAXON_ID=2866 /ORGANISM="Crypthecodinium cohnii, Strain Seligo" /LENGTH=470 /DNA_ID=CAMNT_0053918165 /DNA_START=147 /DNA_END=1559 /DNA_ORIENTATION=+
MGAKSELFGVFRVYWSLLLGNIVEWYEFAVYGYLATHLETHFFRGSAVGVWLGFSVTFLARPLGGILLGWVGDRYGRSVSVNLSIIGMLIGTCGQGLLPTLDCGISWLGNIGLVLLIIFRFIQGLSAAGEVSTITSYLAEVSSPSILSRGTALVNVTASVGFLLAQFVCFLLETIFGSSGVEQFAWRIPFLLAIVPGGIAVIGRRGIPESAMFLEAQEKCEGGAAHEAIFSKLKHACKYWPNMLLTFGAVTTFAVLQYGCLVWVQTFLATHGASKDHQMVVGLITRCLQIVLGLPVGWLSDIVGVGWMMTISAGLTMISGLPLWCVVASHPANLLATSLAFGLGFGLLGTLTGSILFHFIVEMFPTEVRNTSIGLAYNVGFAIFGGLAPFEATLLYKAHWTGPGFLYMFAGFAGLISMLLCRHLQKSGTLQIPYIREAPYFGVVGPAAKVAEKMSAPLDGEEEAEAKMSV